MKPLVLIAMLALGGMLPLNAQVRATAATAETRYVDVQGNRIAYRSIGTGAPLVLVTRMRGTLDTWDPLFLDSLAKERRVITVDYPGVGYSNGHLPADMSAAADFVDSFTREIGLDRYALLGWSWGGLVSQAVVVDKQGRLTHAIFLATNPVGLNALSIQQAFLDRAFKPINDLADEEVLFFKPSSQASRDAAKASRARIHARQGVDARIPSTKPEIEAYLAAASKVRDDAARREALKHARIPLLVICGDNDISTQAGNWFPLSKELLSAQMLVLPDSGHAPHHQYPQLTARYIVDFLTLTGE